MKRCNKIFLKAFALIGLMSIGSLYGMDKGPQEKSYFDVKSQVKSFFDAIRSHNLTTVKDLLKDESIRDYINMTDITGWTPLTLAASYADLKMVKLLLENGAAKFINKANKYGQTALYWAVFHKRLEMAKLLLENGAQESVNKATTDEGKTPLFYAVFNNNPEMVMLLLANGAKKSINKDNGGASTPLFYAVRNENLKMVKLLLFFGAQVTDEMKKLELKNNTLIKLINNPDDLKKYCSDEEYKEFMEIKNKSKE